MYLRARIMIDPWKRNIENQIESFYQKYDYVRTNQIEFEIVDDIYKRRLELVKNSKKEIEVTNNKKEMLLNDNGHVVLGYKPNEKITVLFSRKKLTQDEHTWLGTVHHEYIHAHDFLDLLPTLNLNNSDEIYNYEYYDEYIFWSEFHARNIGSTNVYLNFYNEQDFSDCNVCNNLYESNCAQLIDSVFKSDFYTIAQCLGRQLTLETLFSSIIPPLQKGLRKYTFSQDIINLYNYLSTHNSFAEVDFSELRRLLMCI